MNATGFALECKRERDAMFALYSDPSGGSAVAAFIEKASLTREQRKLIFAALDTALTDAFYTMLLGIDGAAALGDGQQIYTLRDELGDVVSSGNGALEQAAYEAFHSKSR